MATVTLKRTSRRRVFATIAALGVIVYALIDVVLQLLPPHYSAISDAESDLAVGPFGWIMAINFFGRGVTSTAMIVAILLTGPRARLRTIGTSLFAVAGLCSAVIAFFPTDIPALSGRGEPPTTVHGFIHLAGASTGFVFALAAFWVLTFWIPGRRLWAALFLGLASLGLVFLALTIVVVPGLPGLPGLLGLAERICLAGILGWVFVVALDLRERLVPKSKAGAAVTETGAVTEAGAATEAGAVTENWWHERRGRGRLRDRLARILPASRARQANRICFERFLRVVDGAGSGVRRSDSYPRR